jgi:two-component system, NarL family, nitrate/nitrite response regulator NarL
MSLPALTPRQRRIAALACDGLSNKEIARQIGISEGSVKLNLHTVYKKLGVANRAALICTFRGKLLEMLKGGA